MAFASKSKFIPSMAQVNSAIKELPNAEDYERDSYDVLLGKNENTSRIITFRRIKYKNRKGTNIRWIFDGKMLVGNE